MACGQSSPAGMRFCGHCGAPLEPLRDERKLVTVVFVDLVDSTRRAESLDVEDVRSVLSSYHDRVRRELERFGGTLEKYIGDAVVAVFGAPLAHEDDAERAVRASLEAAQAVAGLNDEDPALDLHIRIGVNTGEALVRIGGGGDLAVVGDVMNTCQRLESAAPHDGILVGRATYVATRAAIDFEAVAPVEARGKADPVPAWRVLGVRARPGAVPDDSAWTPLVDRVLELDALHDLAFRVRETGEPQLVTLVAVPGMGKSRLVHELRRRVAESELEMEWLHGRSLAYGEEMAVWALGEIVKTHVGVVDSDDAEKAEAKLAAGLRMLFDDTEAERVGEALRPLLGLAPAGDAGADAASRFPAWRRLIEGVAERRPLGLVFEDLHWADDLLLDFIDHLAEWVTGVPLVMVCTARPELLERRPTWGGGKRNATSIALSPLSESDTQLLVAELLAEDEGAQQAAVAERVGGNPLYAEQYAAMVRESGGGYDAGAEAPPESVQALIAARLDLQPMRDKQLLQDAAVFGRVFWSGAVAALGDRSPEDLEARFDELVRRDFLRRVLRSSVPGEAQYAFRHALLQDVAYAQIPRAQRAERHEVAARWLESLAGDRVADRAGLVAHHYVQALAYAPPARRGGALETRARQALVAAGHAASATGASALAAERFARALELTPADDPERPRLLLEAGRAQWNTERTSAGGVLAEAAAALAAAGDDDGLAEAEVRLARVAWERGEGAELDAHLRRAQALARPGAAATASRAMLLSQQAFLLSMQGRHADSIESACEALAMAELLDLADVQAAALLYRGKARARLGDGGGLADLRRSVALAEETSSAFLPVALNTLGSILFEQAALAESSEVYERAREEARRGGPSEVRMLTRLQAVAEEYLAGRWDDALRTARALVSECEARGSRFDEAAVRHRRAPVLLGRGDLAGALEDANRMLEVAESIDDRELLLPALALSARTHGLAGRSEEAAVVADRALSRRESLSLLGLEAGVLAQAMLDLGRGPEMAHAFDGAVRTPWLAAAQALCEGQAEAAVARYAAIGAQPDAAEAALRAADALHASGRPADARPHLETALRFFREAGATDGIRRAEALLDGRPPQAGGPSAVA
jgi:class 3 adenylate cyclase/predicted ATPase